MLAIKSSHIIWCFARFFVTLERKAILLYINAVRRIEKNSGLRIGDRSISANIKVVRNDEVITSKIT